MTVASPSSIQQTRVDPEVLREVREAAPLRAVDCRTPEQWARWLRERLDYEDPLRLQPDEVQMITPFQERLQPSLLQALIGFWSDVDELRQRAGINVGASPAAWQALNGLVADGLAECSGSDLQYRLTDAGRAARAKVKECRT